MSTQDITGHAIDAEDFDPTTNEGIDALLEFLKRDGGRVPCSRYGHDTETCAPWAVAALLCYIEASGLPDAPMSDAIDADMSLVVNDHDDVLYLVTNYGEFLADYDHAEMQWVWEEAETIMRDELERRIADAPMHALRRVDELLDEIDSEAQNGYVP